MYDSEDEILRIVRGFESCETAAADFHHREHLVVAVWYLQTMSPEEALVKMRTGLLRFLDRHGVDRKIYSEEITVFWVDAIASKLRELGSETPLLDKVNQIISSFNSPTHTPASPTAAAE